MRHADARSGWIPKPFTVFLDKSAALCEAERERLLKDSGQIRAGIMPQAYQFAEGSR